MLLFVLVAKEEEGTDYIYRTKCCVLIGGIDGHKDCHHGSGPTRFEDCAGDF